MSQRLDDLASVFRPKAMEFLARCVEAKLLVMIIDTLRTPAEHAENVRKGVSWVTRSKHLDGLAIDVAPYEQYVLHGAKKLEWDADDPAWQQLGAIGESIGLRWGGRWRQQDLGHFEYQAPAAPKQVA